MSPGLPPIIVHDPRNPRQAFKTFQKHGPNTKYLSRCGKTATVAEGVEIKKCLPMQPGDSPFYLSCGPNPRYYASCERCGEGRLP